MSYRGGSANEMRVQRRRQEDLEAEIGRSRQYGPDNGCEVLLGRTTAAADGGYPAAAQAFYSVEVLLAGGTETEGSPAVLTDLGYALLAANVGTAIPPVGTLVRVDDIPQGRYVFTYNG